MTKSAENTPYKTHQIAPFLKQNLGRACPRSTLAMRMASPCPAIPNSEKKVLAPPPKYWGRPCVLYLISHYNVHAILISFQNVTFLFKLSDTTFDNFVQSFYLIHTHLILI